MYRLALWLSGSVALLALWLCRLCGLALAQPQCISLEGVVLLRSFYVLRSAFCALRSAFVGIFLICLTAGARHVSLGRSARMHDRFCDTAAALL